MTQEQKIILGVSLLSALILGFAVFFLGKNTPKSGLVDQTLLVRENSNQIASGSAKVTLVEFGDYQCPACALAHPVVKQLTSEYQGRINFVFRHFPLPQHPNAMLASKVAEAAGSQGKYWQMHDLLYSSQKDWGEAADPTELFVKYAKDLGLDETAFKTAISSETYFEKINGDKNDGNAVGVNSTPSFYINGIKTNGFGYPEMKQQIEKALQY